MSHPVQLVFSNDDRSRSRVMTFFNGLVIIPHAIVLGIYRAVATVAAVCGGIVTFFTKHNPEGIHNFVAGYLAYEVRVNSFMFLLVKEYPPFPGGDDPYPVSLTVAPPVEQGRLGVLFRTLLMIPAVFVYFGLAIVLLFTYVGSWFAIMFTGKTPEGCQAWGEKTMRYASRFSAYQYYLTPVYPSTDEATDVAMSAGVAPAVA
ncbi:MAG: hypothetical protein JWM98_568 [Thermoleophilia bacterium]|nr:hypothetical protein [Thermoleophilia bacterium]